MDSVHGMKTCARCLLPETFPNADIDSTHQCSYCREHLPFTAKGEAELRKRLSGRHGEKYDVVVPISGGKDSTYILWYAKQVLQLRVIAVNYDSGLQADLSKENMRNACNRLGVPLEFKTVNHKRQVAMLRSILRVAEAVNCYFHVCGNCENGIRSSTIRVAQEHRVPYILHGDDPLVIPKSVASFTGSGAFFSKLKKNKKVIPRVLRHLIPYVVHSALQQREMGLPLRRWLFHPLHTAPWPETVDVVHFYQYIQWNPAQSIRVIKEELGWKSPDGKDSRFDCLVHCFGNLHWLHEVGISSDGFLRSAMLREGIINSEKAISDEEHIRKNSPEECKKAIDELGLKNFRIPT